MCPYLISSIQNIFIYNIQIQQVMFRDAQQRKKSIHYIMRTFYTTNNPNSKVLPKLIQQIKNQKHLNLKFQKSVIPLHGSKRRSYQKDIKKQTQRIKIFKKPIMFQLNLDDGDNYVIQNNKPEPAPSNKQINKGNLIAEIQKYNWTDKLDLVLNKVAYKNYTNQNYILKQLHKRQSSLNSNYQTPNIIINPQITNSVLTSHQTISQSIHNIPESSDTIKIDQQNQYFSKKTQQYINTPKKRKLQFDNHDQTYKYYLGPGNNSKLVRRIMKKRLGWSQTSQSNSIFNFRWTQNSQNQKYNTFLSNHGYKQMVNHFQFHQQITTKSGLLRNLKNLSEKQQKFNLFDVTPITFQIDFKQQQFCEPQLKRFMHYFLDNIPSKRDLSKTRRKQQQRKLYNMFLQKIKHIHNLQNHTYQKKQHPNSKPVMKSIYIHGDTYLWLLKPTGLNRGRGIYLFHNLDQLAQILIQYYQRNQRLNLIPIKREVSSVKQKTRQNKEQTSSKDLNINSCIRSQSFVIQKYIQKPMLIHNRKYDIRVWVLLTHELDLYFFKQGYIRTSCQQFNIQKKDLYVHLTNNAVQKNSQNYGTFQKGNQLSFDDLQKIFEQSNQIKPKKDGQNNQELNEILKQKFLFRKNIIPEMKRMICLPFESIRKRMNEKMQKYCFEIYGFDFMIDEELKPWLIEINTNPCIQQSSPILERLLPRMLDDGFALTLDVIFNNKRKSGQKYKVDNYEDNENMWQLLQGYKKEDRKSKKQK